MLGANLPGPPSLSFLCARLRELNLFFSRRGGDGDCPTLAPSAPASFPQVDPKSIAFIGVRFRRGDPERHLGRFRMKTGRAVLGERFSLAEDEDQTRPPPSRCITGARWLDARSRCHR